MLRPRAWVGLLLWVALGALGALGQVTSPAYRGGFAAGSADARAALPPNPHKYLAYNRGDDAFRRDFTAGYEDGYRGAHRPAMIELARGTELRTVLDQPLNVMTLTEGFPINLAVAVPVSSGGETVVPAGAWVRGHLGAVTRAGPQHGISSMVLRLEKLELPGRPPLPLVAHLESVNVPHTHVRPERSQVTGIEYGHRRAYWVGALVGAGLGALLFRRAGGKGELTGAGIGAVAGFAGGLHYEDVHPHDPTLLLPIGASLNVRTDQPVVLWP